MKKKLIVIILLILVTITLFYFFKKNEEYKQRQEDLKIVSLSRRACYLNAKKYLAVVAADSLERLIEAAEDDGMCLIVMSGYRSYERQEILYNSAQDKSLVAYPGTSEHETGLAVDFGGCPMNDAGARDDSVERPELALDFELLPEYEWLKNNAHKFGFYQSYTEENQEETGFKPEPWHWKFKY